MTPCCLRLENESDMLILTDAIRMRSSKVRSIGSASPWMRRYLGAAAAKIETHPIKAGIKPSLQVRRHRSRAIAPSWNDADNITVEITMAHPTHGHYGESAFDSMHASAIASRAQRREVRGKTAAPTFSAAAFSAAKSGRDRDPSMAAASAPPPCVRLAGR